MTQDNEKFANAFYKGAKPDSFFESASPFWFFDFFLIGKTINLYRRLLGGLWVGGSIVLSESDLQFIPNALNRNIHETGSINPIRIAYSQVDCVSCRFGILTGIIDVTHRGGTFTFRCFNAKALAIKLERLCAKKS